MVSAHDQCSDEELLRLWGESDRDAGEALFERHVERISRFFRAKGFIDVDDLVQHTLLACVEARGRVRQASSFSVFLFQIARHKALDALRARYQDHRAFDPLRSSVAELAPTPSQILAEDARRQALHHHIQALPVELQMTLELHYWENLKAREIAEVFEVPEGTVRSRLRLAKERLRRAMRHEVTSDDFE